LPTLVRHIRPGSVKFIEIGGRPVMSMQVDDHASAFNT
jgi:hypothetical protein